MNPSPQADPIRAARTTTGYRRGPNWVAALAALLTFPLLLVGGTVTTYRVGLAVPDWPTTFGINMFVYDFWNSAWGVFIEHSHRLYGAAVGLLTIVLAIYFQWSDQRPWMKAMGWLTLAAVVGQGILGGLRVRWMSTTLAAVHGCTGQAFFALLVALFVLTGRRWIEAGAPRPDPSRLRIITASLVALVYAQVVAGAWLRHYGAGLVVHATLAALVAPAAVAVAILVLRNRAACPELAPASRLLIASVSLQVLLGIGAWWTLRPFDGIQRVVTTYQAMLRTGHQSNAALLLGVSLVLALRAARHLTTSSLPAMSTSSPSRSVAPQEAMA
ncbi:COX15/CtaA family protein [Isosphaeraceae bacterium EP7]